MTAVPVLTVYERADCHLCEDMLHTLSEWRAELEFEIERVDVESAPELVARYGPKVPVLALGSTEVCHYFLDLDALRRALAKQ